MGFDGDRGLMLHVGLKKTTYGFLTYPYYLRTQTSVGMGVRTIHTVRGLSAGLPGPVPG